MRGGNDSNESVSVCWLFVQHPHTYADIYFEFDSYARLVCQGSSKFQNASTLSTRSSLAKTSRRWRCRLNVRRTAFQRPFDRGPPRVDRCSAMRACTVLLI